jgi:hypothetical protein
MQITKLEVQLFVDGDKDSTKRELVKDVDGLGVGTAGELVIQRSVTQLDPQSGKVMKLGYPAVVYAPGTWSKVEAEAKATTVVLPMKSKVERIH